MAESNPNGPHRAELEAVLRITWIRDLLDRYLVGDIVLDRETLEVLAHTLHRSSQLVEIGSRSR